MYGGVAAAADLILLFLFKYLPFLSENIASLIHNKNIIVQIALPIGISFFTFQMLSYIFDIVRGKVKAHKNPFHVLLYATMFPQLVAGPIVRYETIAEEIDNRQETHSEFTDGMVRFVYGLGKKVLLSDYLAAVSDAVFMQGGNLSVATAWLGAVCYTLQIYFDFSGYSDMAIGLGLILGFHFPENFNYPYAARSVSDFWKRWHISLSAWFRDYLYIPLGGSRTSNAKWIRNLLLVWLSTGIWHGANWTFIAWGLIYFCILVFEKMVGVRKIQGYGFLSQIYTWFVIMAAWVVFRSATLMDAVIYLGNMIGIGDSGLMDDTFLRMASNCKVPLITALILSFPVYRHIKDKVTQSQGRMIDAAAVLIIFPLSLLHCIASSYSPFIYFNF